MIALSEADAQHELPRLPSRAEGYRNGRTDARLLSLASELEAAARPYLAYDRDAEVTSADPDYQEAMDTGRRLYGAVKAVADRILACQPESMAGLLLQAHAAALMVDGRWDDAPEHVDHDGTLLRLLANGLFRLAGVDWRGRSIGVGSATRAVAVTTATADDAALIAIGHRFDADFLAWLKLAPGARQAEAEVEAELEGLKRAGRSPDMDDLTAAWGVGDRRAAHRREADAFDRLASHLNAILKARARTPMGLAVKARALVCVAWPDGDFDPAGSDDEWHPNDHIRDLIVSTCVLAGVDWRGRPLSGRETSPASRLAPSPDAALIPLAEAAIAEHRAANAVSEAAGHDAPPGTFVRSMQLLELVTAMDARTAAGVTAKARVLLAHAPDKDDLDGDWRCQALALSVACDAACLGAAQ